MNLRRVGLIIVVVIFAAAFLLNRKDVILTNQDSFDLEYLSATGYELKSAIHLYNPNLLSSTIKTIHEKFSINGIQTGELDIEINQGIPGRKETEFPVSVRFTKEDYTKAIQNDSLKKEVEVISEGTITYGNFTGGGTIKVHQTAILHTN